MGTSPRPSNELLVPIERHSFSVTPTKRSFAWTFGASDPVPLGKGSSCGSLLSHCCLFGWKRTDCLRCFSSQLGSWQDFPLGQALTMCPDGRQLSHKPFWVFTRKLVPLFVGLSSKQISTSQPVIVITFSYWTFEARLDGTVPSLLFGRSVLSSSQLLFWCSFSYKFLREQNLISLHFIPVSFGAVFVSSRKVPPSASWRHKKTAARRLRACSINRIPE